MNYLWIYVDCVAQTKMMSRIRHVGLQVSLLGLAVILASCTAGDGLTPALDTIETSAIEATTAPALTSTPSLQPGDAPTDIPSPTPDVPLYDDGAWLLFQGSIPDNDEMDSHLWAVNWDGTGLTDLLPDFYVYQYKVQPIVDGSPGRYVAAITSHGWSDEFMFTLVRLPDGKVIANIPLTTPETELIDMPQDANDPNWNDAERRSIVSMSISDLRSLAWSPDGTQIAFVGAQDGKKTDVYLYSLEDGSVSRLTRGQHPHQASNLLWSPDGTYIAYDDISCPDYVYCAEEVWVVRSDGSMAKQVASLDQWPQRGEYPDRLDIVDWTSDHTIAINGTDIETQWHFSLKEIDVENGATDLIEEGMYSDAVFGPNADAWFLLSESGDPDAIPRQAVYTLLSDDKKEVFSPALYGLATWWPEKKVFITPQGLLKPDGEWASLDLPASLPASSPDGKYWAFPNRWNILWLERLWARSEISGFWIGEAGQQPIKITDMPLQVIQWSANSQSLLLTDPDGSTRK